jgi:RF-1 domain
MRGENPSDGVSIPNSELRVPRVPRRTWTHLTDPQLLAQCDVDTYRASGPGGQKRNKTSSAVRLRHGPTGILVIAEESRSQHENKAKALKRVRQALYLHLRDDMVGTAPESVAAHPDLAGAVADGRLPPSVKNPHFWPAAGVALDLLVATHGQVSTAAEALGVSTAHLVDFLRLDPKVWQEVNRVRSAAGLKGLK